jgi:hypothetical protein
MGEYPISPREDAALEAKYVGETGRDKLTLMINQAIASQGMPGYRASLVLVGKEQECEDHRTYLHAHAIMISVN